MNRSKYIQSIRATKLTWNQWEEMIKANERKIKQLQRAKRLVLTFIITFVLSSVILALIIL